MKIIPYPGSGLTKRGNSSENHRMDYDKPLYLKRQKSGGDKIEISAEAKMRFQQDNIVKLDRARLMKEAREYFRELDRDINFNDADPRKNLRGEKIAEAKIKSESGFYDNMENNILRIIAEKKLF
jgi:hypothetical protein